MKFFLTILTVLLACLSISSSANEIVTDNVKATIIVDVETVKPGDEFYIALQLDIRDGWHTYWRNPGDSGQATSIDWVLPDGVVVSDIEWPYPERQYMGPVANYGYHGEAYHRVRIQTPRGWPVGQPLVLFANAKWLVCEEECIPEKGQFKLEIKTAERTEYDSDVVNVFERIESLLPVGLELSSAYQYFDKAKLRFEFEPKPELLTAKSIEYFPYDWGVLQAPVEQEVVIDSDFVTVTSTKGDLTFDDALLGVLVVSGESEQVKAYQVASEFGVLNVNSGKVEPNDVPSLSIELSIWAALFFAFLGGVILNLMPCVFPVLSMKALSLVSHSTETSSVNRLNGVAYTIGILSCFAILGVALLIVQAAGEEVGWGFQLQSPMFVSVLVMVLFTLGLSLSGYLEVGTTFMGLGSGLASKSGYTGSFFTGVLAVVVATPCTAPFMGPALGFALTQPPFVMLSVLMALGLGLALPYLLLSFFPVLTHLLPKPGAWMKTFQQFLAFPMFLTSAWLIWVLGLQTGANGVFAILVVLILISFAIWLLKKISSAKQPWKAVGVAIGVLVCSLIVVITATKLRGSVQATSSEEQSNAIAKHYQAFTPARLDSLRKQGSAVFVNMTAAWCITCLANEKVALSTNELKTYFSENDITYLKGDWTNQDPEITDFLQSFGRNSVPLYVFYPASNGGQRLTPIVLPQILTVEGVVNAMQSATLSTPLSLIENEVLDQ